VTVSRIFVESRQDIARFVAFVDLHGLGHPLTVMKWRLYCNTLARIDCQAGTARGHDKNDGNFDGDTDNDTLELIKVITIAKIKTLECRVSLPTVTGSV
jgi:hypothetical protein